MVAQRLWLLLTIAVYWIYIAFYFAEIHYYMTLLEDIPRPPRFRCYMRVRH